MSTINRHNYEAYFLDYLEGNLNAEDTALLMQFLENNPDLKSEVEGIELMELNADNGIQFDKSSLRQNINADNVEDYIIASVENVIDEEDKPELEEYLNGSTEAMALAERYKKAILSKPEINYPEKSRLKKNNVVIRYMVPLTSAAAAIAIVLFLVNPFSTEKTSTPVAIHQVETNKGNMPVAEGNELDSAKTNDAIEKEKEIAMAEKSDLTHPFAVKTLNKQVRHEENVPEKETIKMDKLEPKSISTVDRYQQPGIVIANHSGITAEIAENVTQPVIDIQENTEKNPEKGRKINLWGVAEVGVRVFGKLNERNYAVEPDFTGSGQLKSVTLTTEQRKITTPAI
jgi:hypothetical protein